MNDNLSSDEHLEKRIKYLKVLHQFGQEISSNIYRNEREILQTLFEHAQALPIDLNNIYIALYDRHTDVVSFALAFINGVAIDIENSYGWRPRKAGKGRTEYVIEKRRSALMKTKAEAEKWYSQPNRENYIQKTFASWLGVPMLYEDKVIGVIATYHENDEYKYGEDDQEVLEILAGQVAVALQNARLVKKIVDIQRISVMSQIGADFAHRLNNLAGTIPIWVKLILKKLSQKGFSDLEIQQYLEQISLECHQLLQAADSIRNASLRRCAEFIPINEITDVALERAITAKPGIKQTVEIIKNYSPDLPLVFIERAKLLETLINLINNGLEAMPNGGRFSIKTRLINENEKGWIAISFTDTGIGISPDNLTKIFDLGFTTKENGMGFGLWRDKTFLKEIGGDIEVVSLLMKGSTFTIMVPLNHQINS